MDPLSYAALCRAENALATARQHMGATDQHAKAKEFAELARCIARASNPNTAMSNLHAVHKAASHVTLDDVWQDGDIQQMAQSFIASVGEPDLLQAIGKYARTFTKFYGKALIATGANGDAVAEGFPKLIKTLDFYVGNDLALTKSTGAVVLSQELLAATGEAGRAMFEGELVKAVIRAANATAVASLIDSNTTQVSAGSDPLASLRAGIRAAGASDGYVASMPAADVAWLATTIENKGGMGVRGGTFVPGIEVVALDDATQTVVIPASRLAFIDGGLELRPSSHATVSMSADPEADDEQVSLWQSNLQGILVERRWRLAGDTSGVVVVG